MGIVGAGTQRSPVPDGCPEQMLGAAGKAVLLLLLLLLLALRWPAAPKWC